MNLGLVGKQALVCASSKGLGLACAEELAANGVNLIMNARGVDALTSETNRLRSLYGINVTAVAADITTPEGRAKVNDFKIETIKSLFLSVPEIMEATIVKFLKRYGNVETYLSEEVGLTTDEINDLKFLLRVNQQIDFDADNNLSLIHI